MKFDRNGKWLSFYCPACGRRHHIDDTWTVSGTDERPTVNPSVLSLYRHPKGHDNSNPAPLGYDGEYVEDRCHLFIRDGVLEYLPDCTHGLPSARIEMVNL